MQKPLLIVGVDPGTTVGYAVLDLGGNMIALGSEKELSLDKLVSKITKLGRVLLVGTDKKKAPAFVEKFKARTGSRIIPCKEDLKVVEKNVLTRKFQTKNAHERDALAAALATKKAIASSLVLLQQFANECSQEEYEQLITLHFLYPEKNIKKTALLLEEAKAKGLPTVNRPFVISNASTPDPSQLQHRIHSLEGDIALLKRYNSRLIRHMRYLQRKEKAMQDKMQYLRAFPQSSAERHVPSLTSEVIAVKQQVALLKSSSVRLRSALLNHAYPIILKKLKNLGKEEFERKKGILQFQEGDILLIDDASVVSASVIVELQRLVTIMVLKRPISNTMRFPFVVIPSSQLAFYENEFFAVADSKEFQMAKEKVIQLPKMLQEYRHERKSQIESQPL